MDRSAVFARPSPLPLRLPPPSPWAGKLFQGTNFGYPARRAWAWAGSLCCLAAYLPAHAAGGHHAVDDAVILEPGQCEVETWFDRERASARTLTHIGPACRAGSVELAFNADSVRQDGLGRHTAGGPQLKWAHALTPTFSVGAVAAMTWRDRSPRALTATVVLPITWQPDPLVAMHVNLGRDYRRGGEPDSSRSGVALEWIPLAQWSFVAERFRDSGASHWRAGVRYQVSDRLSLDVSRAEGLRHRTSAWWTIGATWGFGR